jgi:hypothetical protein
MPVAAEDSWPHINGANDDRTSDCLWSVVLKVTTQSDGRIQNELATFCQRSKKRLSERAK